MTIQKNLAAAIESWLEAKKGRSLHSLSRLTSVSYSSVRRAAQGEVEQEQSTVVAVASVVMKNEELKIFISKYYPELQGAVVENRDSNSYEDQGIEEFLDSDDHFVILLMANSRNGTNEKEIAHMFGESKVPYFEDIKNSNVLVERDGRWYFEGNISIASLDLSRRLLRRILSQCDRRNDSVKYASFSYTNWESLTSEAARELYNEASNYSRRIYEITSNPKNHGNILVVMGLIHNVLKGQEELG